MNNVQLFGNIGKDPETITAGNGTQITKFSLATSEKYKDEETTTWHNCVAFGKTAEIIAQYVHKGDKLLVEGKISNSTYDKNGVTMYKSEIIVNKFHFIPNGKKNSSSDAYDGVLTPNSKEGGNDADDDLPF